MGTGPVKDVPCSGRLSQSLATEAASHCGAASIRAYFRVDFRVARRMDIGVYCLPSFAKTLQRYFSISAYGRGLMLFQLAL